MSIGIDYSFARPGGKAIKSAGYNFVCRYLASADGKRIDSSEVADLHANNLGIVLVFEDYANQSLNGHDQGVADAQEALSQANAIGFPADRPIYFAVDFDATAAQQTAIDDYLRGATSVIGANRVGVYGGFYVVQRCSQNGTARWFWQTLAWSGGQQFSGNHIYQDGGSAFNGGADTNVSKQSDFGQWPVSQGDMFMVDRNILNDMYFACFGRRPYDNTTGQWVDASAQGYLGQPADVVLHELLLSSEFGKRQEAIAQAMAQANLVPGLQSEIASLKKQIADLQNKPPTPQPTPTPTPPAQGGLLWEFLHWLGVK